ncbi:hypothetical protein B296_00029235 [Ensete ventricosum]|uniref:Uncharacterized protein n=1 Tax=Ensete ventricosum TaxID=4639 RepID=A0A427AFR0_ENSVE|nr:hypothetical protein B296_00029235 [Ensete ventricosum]
MARSPQSPLSSRLLNDQVGMASSPSFTTSGLTPYSSSSVHSPRVGGCRPSGHVGGRSEPSSLLTRSDVKAIRAMKMMKLCHDFDSTLSIESLVLIRKHFSILNEYALHAPLPGQRSYHEYPGGFISELEEPLPITKHDEGGFKPHSSKGKEQARTAGETQTPRPRRPKSVKELCQTSAREDDAGFYALHMIDLPVGDPGAPLEVQ